MATADQKAWISRVLGIATEAAAFDTAGLSKRVAAVTTDMKLHNAASQMAEGVKHAIEALRSQNPDAEAQIDALEKQLAQIASAARRAEAVQTIGKGAVGKVGVVAFAKMRLRWNDAQSSYSEAVTNLVDGLAALMLTDDFADDPRSEEPDVPGLIQALADRLPKLDEIADAIDDALDSRGNTPEQRTARMAAASKAIDSYRSRLAEFSDLKDYESTNAGSYPSISLIEASLAELKAALADGAAGAESMAEPERTAA